MDLKNWARWYRKNVVENSFFKENKDYQRFFFVKNGNEVVDFSCTLDMSKHLVMQMPTDKAFDYRQYLIDYEKNKVLKLPSTYKEALLELIKSEEEKEKLQLKVKEQQPKVDFYNEIIESKDTCDMQKLAGVLNIKGLGRNNLFELLREKAILNNDNIPYRSYIDRGYFKIIETKFTKPSGDISINFKTVVYQKGVDFVRKLIKQEEQNV